MDSKPVDSTRALYPNRFAWGVLGFVIGCPLPILAMRILSNSISFVVLISVSLLLLGTQAKTPRSKSIYAGFWRGTLVAFVLAIMMILSKREILSLHP